MKRIICIITAITCFSSLQAQTFVTKGKIEFERKVNIHANMGDNSWTQAMKKNIPQFKTTYFDLYFDNGKTLYKPGREVQELVKIPDWFLGPANDNSVFTDLEKQTTISQKNIVDATYILTDSTRKFDWKITNDTRTIAGIECRRATAIIMDSVFVVAFYTDQIIPSGGPESINGLPGMILGVAIPRLHTTWYATKLQVIDVKESDLVAPTKGKKTNKIELGTKLAAVLKDWGGDDNGKNVWNWQVML